MNTAEDAPSAETHRFDQERVSLGRARENDLTLPDPRRVVSKQHAEVRQVGEACQLWDRGSKNFTYLNGDRLEPEEPYDLTSGDTFTVGDFEVVFERVEAKEAPATPAAPAAGDETMFAASFENPFDNSVAQLASALAEIVDTYDETPHSQRFDALRDALRLTDLPDGGEEAVALIGRFLGLGDATAEHETEARETEARDAAGGDREATGEAAPAPEEPDERAGEPPPAAPAEASGGHAAAVQDALFETVAQTIRIPWQFRHEFIGQTIVQSSDHVALYEGDPATLAAYLTDGALSDEEAAERRAALREAASKLVVHQMAMLDGYKASAQSGTQEFLGEVDPAQKERQLQEDGSFYARLPLLSDRAVLEEVKAAVQELENEDWSIVERKIFRPAFIKAYLARMTSAGSASAPPTR